MEIVIMFMSHTTKEYSLHNSLTFNELSRLIEKKIYIMKVVYILLFFIKLEKN